MAAGDPLPKTQDEIFLNGHAFEARIYAEEPRNNFMPGAGSLSCLIPPQPSEHVRVETGVQQGDEVSVHYDPMIAKLVVWSPDRDSALRKLRNSLSEYNIAGLNTNVSFLMDLCQHPEFRAGNVHTDFIPQHHDALFRAKPIEMNLVCQAALAIVRNERAQSQLDSEDRYSPFGGGNGFRVNHTYARKLKLQSADDVTDMVIKYQGLNEFIIEINGKSYVVCDNSTNDSMDNQSIFVDGILHKSRIFIQEDSVHLFTRDGSFEFRLPEPSYISEAIGSGPSGGTVAPMPGVIEKIFVGEGDKVNSGDPLIIMIAMKMEYIIKAPHAGIIDKVLFNVGDSVGKNTPLILFQKEES